MGRRQFAVIGIGTFGFNVARLLAEKGADVIAIDQSEEKIANIRHLVTQSLVADATEEKVLRQIGIGDVDVVVVSIGESMEASIMVTLLLKDLGVKNVIVKANSSLHARIAARVGADRVVFPENDQAERLAQSLISPNILEQIELSPDYNILEIVAPPSFIKKTLRDLDVRARYNVSVIAIKKKVPYLTESGETDLRIDYEIAPSAEEEIEEGNTLVVIGQQKDLERFKKLE